MGEATLTRLYLGHVGAVLGGLQRLQAHTEAAAKAIANCWVYLDEHRHRTFYRQFRKGSNSRSSGPSGREAPNLRNPRSYQASGTFPKSIPGGKISSQLKDLHAILISILLIIQWLKYAPGIAGPGRRRD